MVLASAWWPELECLELLTFTLPFADGTDESLPPDHFALPLPSTTPPQLHSTYPDYYDHDDQTCHDQQKHPPMQNARFVIVGLITAE